MSSISRPNNKSNDSTRSGEARFTLSTKKEYMNLNSPLSQVEHDSLKQSIKKEGMHEHDSKGIENDIPDEIFTSSDPNFWDYVRLKDITKNTGIEAKDCHSFSLKELLDNAADFSEKYCCSDAFCSIRMTAKIREICERDLEGNPTREQL